MRPIGHLEVEERDGVALVRLFGEVDISNAETILERLAEAGLGVRGGLVLDLSQTEYLDSSWLFLVTRLSRTLATGGRGFLLVAPVQAPTRRMLDLINVQHVVGVAPDVGAAVAALGDR
jgi:anti-anti-sigma factor